eukprot:TRINITY_DN91226_c0_g1_i1.p1 TRINITY_DN91226_c0_g1~~TRINITY_DN91226_c0_g1_i1.p1  ORF type:complete len:649 (-),score=220.00 TRINITY_DN91226_c0_g1_i1:99-2045(-)
MAELDNLPDCLKELIGSQSPQSVAAKTALSPQASNGSEDEDQSDSLRKGIRASLVADLERAVDAWSRAETGLEKRLNAPDALSGTDVAALTSDIELPMSAILTAQAAAAAKTEASPKKTNVSEVLCRLSESKPKFSGAFLDEKVQRLDEARAHRAQQLRFKSADAKISMEDLGKRGLRKKVVDICKEVSRRQKLKQQQESARKFRERRFRHGHGPSADLGDASEFALGLNSGIFDPADIEGQAAAASPRRVSILETLSMQEFEKLRQDTHFFFVGAFGPGEEDEDLIDFFMPSRNDKDITVAEYVRRLRQKIEVPKNSPKHGRREAASPLLGGGVGFHDALSTSLSSPGFSKSWSHVDMMPCMGKKPAVRDDMRSPTLHKVRDVLNRRDALNEKIMRDREETMNARAALSSFKAKEQHREIMMNRFKQTELHKMRMLEAKERKEQREAEDEENLLVYDAQQEERLARTNLRAERCLEARRIAASQNIDDWVSKVERCERNMNRAEAARIKGAEESWDKYVEKLWKIGIDRHTRISSQAQKNDKLKSQIQSSLVQQLSDQQKRESIALMQEIEEKQGAAAWRREHGLKSRYNFVEKAFGEGSHNFDHRHHCEAVDRRSASWRKSSEAWARQSDSFGDSSSMLRKSASVA